MDAPIVRDLVVRAVEVPMARPLATRVGAFARWPLVLLDLHTDDGLTGRSYLAPYLRGAVATLVPLLHELGAALRGRPAAPTAVAEATRGWLSLTGRQGFTLAALSSLDVAAWDVLAQAAGLPLVRLLGGEPGPVLAYNSNGLGLGHPDRVGAEAVELLAEGGFRALKVRLGRASAAEDLAAVRAVRAAVGDDVELVVDYNQGLDLAAALTRCRALDDEGVTWIEEPLRYDDLDGHARLARDTRTPIMLGENFYGTRPMLDAIRSGACDLIMPDLGRIGGVTGWLRAAAMAEVTGMPMSSHLYPEVSAQLLRVTPTAGWLEWQNWADPVLARPPLVRDGHAQPPDVPGNGLVWDEDAVAAHVIEL